MSKLKDLTGMKFGRLTVIKRVENNSNGKPCWFCQCDCGNTCVVSSQELKKGDTKSCGCLRKENTRVMFSKHNLHETSAYSIWCGIKDRCFRANHKNFELYGGRGITMYPAWIDDFQAFYDYVSKLEHFSEKGYSFDRIDNNGNYEPDNLRLANQTTQNRNTRRNIIVDYNGESMPLVEASELSGINYNCLKRRHQRGDIGERLFRPVRHISR